MNDSRQPKPKGRWYQFSLRTLLISVVVFALCCWPAARLYERRNDAAIHRSGGRISSDRDHVSYYFCKRVKQSDLAYLKGLITFRRLDFSWSNITDAGLEHLRELTDLEYPSLCYTGITDAGLEHFKGLTSLRTLYLVDTQVTDAGLEHLKGLTKLESLALAPRQSDAGLVHLKGMADLEALFLDREITDAGLVHLKGLEKLRLLDLRKTQVSNEGVEELQQALPNCKIHY